MIYLLLLYIIDGAIWIYLDSKNHDKIQRTIADIKFSGRNDDLRTEYNLEDMVVRRVGPDRQYFADRKVLSLDPNLEEHFPDNESVNAALRCYLLNIEKEKEKEK